MAITGAQLAQDAMFMAGVLGQDGTTNPQGDSDVALVLRVLYRMLDEWATQDLLVYSNNAVTFNLSAGVASYSTSAFSSPARPVSISAMRVTYAGVDYPVDMIDYARYNQIAIKTIQAIPGVCYYNPGMPDGLLTFYPIPYAAMVGTAYVSERLNSANITPASSFNFPPGYESALVSNLARAICPYFGQPVTPDLERQATRSLAAIKQRNAVPGELSTPFDADNSFAMSYICYPW